MLECLTPEGRRKFELDGDSPRIEPARVLCRYHNNSLSPLDAVVERLARGLCSVSLSMLSQSSVAGWLRWTLLNGHDVERYMVKMFIGAAAAGLPGIDKWRFPRNVATASAAQLRVLRGEMPLACPNSLYVKASSDLEIGGPVERRVADIGIRPLFEDDAIALAGVMFRVFGIDLLLWCSEFGTAPREDLGDLAYRPSTIDTVGDQFHVATMLSWDRHFEHRMVRFRRVELLPGVSGYDAPTWNTETINRAQDRRQRDRRTRRGGRSRSEDAG
jgi:hypothetical protein